MGVKILKIEAVGYGGDKCPRLFS